MSRSLMLIDDSEADRLYARIVLERAGLGIEVLDFESAGDALSLLRGPAAGHVGLILLDINMPGINGFEFLEAFEAMARAQAPVVVMLTSSPDPADRERALAHRSVRGYITKPLALAAARELGAHVAGPA